MIQGNDMPATLSLTEMANQFKTDKGTQTKEAHGYSLVYDLLFSGYRENNFNLLEIGLAIGGPELGGDADREVVRSPSVELWIKYFPKARIFGADISDFSKLNYDRFTFTQIDCSSPEEVRKLLDLGVKFDVIIDDASHASYHQQVTLANLFPALNPGGLFIIEDLHWQPEAYEKTLPPVPKTSKWLSNFMATGKVEETAGVTTDQAQYLISNILSVTQYTKNELDKSAQLYNCLQKIPSIPSHQINWCLLPMLARQKGIKNALRAILKQYRVKLVVIQHT